jgi:hypothetical protein
MDPSLMAARRTSIPGPRFSAWACVALILAGAVWLYLPALDTPFFADDYLFLDQVRGHPLLASLASPDPLSNFYRPVSRQLYFWLVGRATHESPFAFHAANLSCFLAILVLLFLIVRRLAGARAGVIATGFLALHYSAEVPIRWACGSQELLAVGWALAAIHWHIRGRRLPAGLAMLLAAFSKEVILIAPLVAAAAGRRPGESWAGAIRRAWPLGGSLAVWGVVWLLLPHARAQQVKDLGFEPAGAFAVLVHLVRVSLGFEWTHGAFGHLPRVGPPWVPLVATLAAVAACWGGGGAGAAGSAGGAQRAPAPAVRRGLVAVATLWALLGTLPIAAVSAIWSAYYYLFAMCGVALGLGVWLARRPLGLTMALLAVLAWGSASARSLSEFGIGRDAWTAQSHINRRYLERATRYGARYLRDLRRQRPTLPRGSTIFFAGLPGNIAFQAGDGALVRWAYRDTSLRSYYLGSFTLEKARRGPFYVFRGGEDSLVEIAPSAELFADMAFYMIASDQTQSARDVLVLERERAPSSEAATSWLAWVQWSLGERDAAMAALQRGGQNAVGEPTPEVEQALAAVSRGDTLGAIRLMDGGVRRHALDPGAHALLADLRLSRDPGDPSGTIEAYAARVLAPDRPAAWRRWGMVQAHRGRYLEALRSFHRYFALAGDASPSDAEAQRWVATIRGMLPSGVLELRE